MKFIPLLYFLLLFLFSDNYSQNLSLWQKLESPTDQLINKIFFIDSSTGWTAGDSGTILKTINGGETWHILYGARDTYMLDLFFLDKNKGWVLYWDNNPPIASRILKTTNGGADWDTASCPGENPFFNTVCFIDSLTGFLAGPPILKTTNGGESWYETYVYDVDSMPPYLAGLPVLEVAFADENNGYACGGFRDLAGVIWHTSDRGETWAASGITADEVFDFHIFDSLNVKALAGDPEGFFPIVHMGTSNGGNTWSTNDLESYGLTSAIAYRTPSEGWGVTWNKFLVTTDSGNAWREYFTPDSVSFLDITFTDTLTGYAAGSGGSIFKYKVPAVTLVEPDLTGIPYYFSLSQNYPNPFNPVTTISYTIPQTGNVEINVYDVLGKKISTLVNEAHSPGYYKIDFDGSSLGSGVYFYTLRSRNYFAVNKMLLIK